MYGSLGGIIALMVWFYLSGMMIVLGGELNAIFVVNEKETCAYGRHSLL